MNDLCWIRLDVPYSENATKMRALLGFRRDGSVEVEEIPDLPDIPKAVEAALKKAGEMGLSSGAETVIIYPHDDRHGIAWPAKEAADKHGLGFNRQTPLDLEPPASTATGYENFDTGSDEDSLDQSEARKLVIELNSEAQGLFSGGELLEAMGPLRHALWLILRSEGWQSPVTAYTLRNLGYVLKATGNPENEGEVRYLIRRLIHVWLETPPDKAVWEGSESLAQNLAELSDALDDPGSAAVFRGFFG